MKQGFELNIMVVGESTIKKKSIVTMQDICGVTSLALPSSQTSTELDCACVLLAHMYLSGCEAVIDSECVYRSY